MEMNHIQLGEEMHLLLRSVNRGVAALDDKGPFAIGDCVDRRRRLWSQLITEGYGIAELREVLWYLRVKVTKHRWDQGCMSVRNLTDPMKFAEHLSNARATLRNVPATSPDQQLAHGIWTRKPDQPRAKVIEDIIPKLLEQMRQAVDKPK